MKLIVAWTFTRWSDRLRPADVAKHELRTGKPNDNQRTGGLGLRTPWGTRYLDLTGRLLQLQPEKKEIHLYLEGGLDSDFKYQNTMRFHPAQALALANEIRSLRASFPDMEIIGQDLRNFDLDLWLKAIGISAKK
jgi:hypothetical protein